MIASIEVVALRILCETLVFPEKYKGLHLVPCEWWYGGWHRFAFPTIDSPPLCVIGSYLQSKSAFWLEPFAGWTRRPRASPQGQCWANQLLHERRLGQWSVFYKRKPLLPQLPSLPAFSWSEIFFYSGLLNYWPNRNLRNFAPHVTSWKVNTRTSCTQEPTEDSNVLIAIYRTIA